jgi:hypothetical protein
MGRFQAEEPNGVAVQQLEVVVRTAIFKPANALIGFLLQAAADRIDAAYQPKPGQEYKGPGEHSNRWHVWFLPAATRLLLP